jgi:hypothetical protein
VRLRGPDTKGLEEKVGGDEGDYPERVESHFSHIFQHIKNFLSQVNQKGEEGASVADEVEIEEALSVGNMEEPLGEFEMGR